MKIRHIFITSFILSFIAFGIGGFLGLRWYSTPINATTSERESFVIPKGQAISIIGERLHEDGFIKHPLMFRIAVKQLSISDKIQAGLFQISPNMTVSEIATALTQGTQDTWITIVEGWRMEEIASSLTKLDLPLFDEEEFMELVRLNSAEGTLFPDTYLIPKQYDAQQVYTLLTSTFQRKVTNALADEIEQNSNSFDEIVVMASLIEREARGYEEMRGVAGVLWGRIEIGMPLQVDATMQYAKGFNWVQNTWWPMPLAVDKSINSPYNTYQIQGLPPAPISNPGLEAITATLRPIATKNLFYIHDSSGTIHYADTLEGHNANVNRYLR